MFSTFYEYATGRGWDIPDLASEEACQVYAVGRGYLRTIAASSVITENIVARHDAMGPGGGGGSAAFQSVCSDPGIGACAVPACSGKTGGVMPACCGLEVETTDDGAGSCDNTWTVIEGDGCACPNGFGCRMDATCEFHCEPGSVTWSCDLETPEECGGF